MGRTSRFERTFEPGQLTVARTIMGLVTSPGDHERTLESLDVVPPRSSGVPPRLYCPDVDWKMDPVLELWVDVQTTPVIIRLRGIIDGQTGTNVRGVVEELLHEGYSSIAMEIDELEQPAAPGYSALGAIEELVRRAGGRLRWSSWSSSIRDSRRPAVLASRG